MQTRPIHLYVGVTTAAALVLAGIQDWSVLGALNTQELLGIISLVVLGVASEAVAIRLPFGSSAAQSSLTFIPVLAIVLLFGPALGVASAGLIMLVSQFVLHDKARIRAIFNVAQWILVCAVSGFAYQAVRGILDLPRHSYPETMADPWLLIPFAVFVVALFLGNYFAVAGAISLDTNKNFATVLQQIIGAAGANIVYGMLISPIAYVVAILYLQFNFRPLGISIALLPLIFVRISYLTNLRLQAANKDLLKALVKAIETRDPYTSGHSLRVSALAGRIASGLGLSQKRIQEIETAALLHDIGKIDAVYTEILRKPESLSQSERAVIESHVTKGVELLQSISTFPSSVIDAVKHHHEREDGKGYPDGLQGEAIPVGSKIIKVCDAIDAMLSDRPYRDALTLAQVREQLITYAGTQFDIRVVSTVIQNNILAAHRESVLESKNWSPLTVLDEGLIEEAAENRNLSDSMRSVLSSLTTKSGRPRS